MADEATYKPVSRTMSPEIDRWLRAQRRKRRILQSSDYPSTPQNFYGPEGAPATIEPVPSSPNK